ncbi:hypothetical protein [Ruania zhangjianzhongii]|uniref:hypothetical protein n=1 Tax=Ruania zhangjianzhongii TaxID=2603206 RepID=UPI001F3FB066|nr:hypothetical protein [Ruania zhangjianzhongii]
MEMIATMILPKTGARVRDAQVFTYPRIDRTAGLRGATAECGIGATGGTLAPGSGPGLR